VKQGQSSARLMKISAEAEPEKEEPAQSLARRAKRDKSSRQPYNRRKIRL